MTVKQQRQMLDEIIDTHLSESSEYAVLAYILVLMLIPSFNCS